MGKLIGQKTPTSDMGTTITLSVIADGNKKILYNTVNSAASLGIGGKVLTLERSSATEGYIKIYYVCMDINKKTIAFSRTVHSLKGTLIYTPATKDNIVIPFKAEMEGCNAIIVESCDKAGNILATGGVASTISKASLTSASALNLPVGIDHLGLVSSDPGCVFFINDEPFILGADKTFEITASETFTFGKLSLIAKAGTCTVDYSFLLES